MRTRPRILFVKPKEIGDSLILTPAIRAAKLACAEAEIWVLVRRGCEGILAGCPEIHRLLALTRVERHERTWLDAWMDLQVLRELRSVDFDLVFELSGGHRGRLFALLARSERRYSVKVHGPLNAWERWRLTGVSRFDGLACHRVETDFRSVSEFLPLPEPIPAMVFEPDRTLAWPEGGALTDFCVLQIGSRKVENRWPREKWLGVIACLLEETQHVVISCGAAAHEVADADWLRAECGPRVIPTLGTANWAQVAGLLYRARLYVGLNTAAMHLAAACGCPIVALFGRTSEEHWSPWRASFRIVSSEDFSHVADPVERQRRNRGRQMADIDPAKVIQACREMMRPAVPTQTRSGP